MGTFASVSRLHIVAIGALGTLTFGWLFLGERPWLLAIISALDWFVVNLLNRVVDLPEDRANRIHGTDFVARNARLLRWTGFLVLFASLAFTIAIVPEITPWRICFHALGLAYNWPLLPGGKRIKQLYFFKNTASAMGFMLTVFAYPLSLAHGELDLALVSIAALFFFPFELSYEIIYDLRDAPGDALAGVKTYPVVHGERAAVRIIDALIASSMIVLAAGYAASAIPWRMFIMICAPLIQLAAYKRALGRGITSRDCIVITWIGTALLAVYHLWIAAGLPGVA